MSQPSGRARTLPRRSRRGLSRIALTGAAGALANMLGSEFRIGDLRECEWSDDPGGREVDTGVFFEMEGAVTGLIGVFLPRALGAALGTPAPSGAETPEAVQESVLREVANIVASHAVSAIADSLAGRVTLTVPVLVVEDAAFVFGRLLADRREEAALIACESALYNETARIRAHLVFAPDAP